MTGIDYWEHHYEKFIKSTFPSQFAVFCLNEMPHDQTIIDCGCGNGRDSFFFEKYGKTVIGLDASTAAINFCKNQASETNSQRAIFHLVNFEDKKDLEKISKELMKRGEKFIIYSRFFLHAIDNKTENNFLDFCCNICNAGGAVFLEFRTVEDEKKQKIEPAHYRRFLNVEELKKKIQPRGFVIEYCVEGVGYAKYKSEDAYVARLILKTG